MSITVYTKEELKKAVDAKEDQIIIRGELAEKVNRSFKLKEVSKVTIKLLVIAIAAIPFTGGAIGVVAVPIATLTGLEIALIIAVIFLGLALVLSIIEKYKKVSYSDKDRELIIEPK